MNNPTVRGEPVVILQENVERPTPGVLGAVVNGADTLVQYPDGEQGYVKRSQIEESQG